MASINWPGSHCLLPDTVRLSRFSTTSAYASPTAIAVADRSPGHGRDKQVTYRGEQRTHAIICEPSRGAYPIAGRQHQGGDQGRGKGKYCGNGDEACQGQHLAREQTQAGRLPHEQIAQRPVSVLGAHGYGEEGQRHHADEGGAVCHELGKAVAGIYLEGGQRAPAGTTHTAQAP